MQEEIIELLKSTNREGIDQLIEFLTEKSDFFKNIMSDGVVIK